MYEQYSQQFITKTYDNTMKWEKTLEGYGKSKELSWYQK